MDQHISFQQKFKKITQSKHFFDNNQLKSLNQLKQFEQRKDPWKQQSALKPQMYSKCIKLQTFYKCCMPAYYSLNWQEEINIKTIRPIAGVVAFIDQGQDYYSVDQKFVTWVQSGGTRVIPIKANATEESFNGFVKNIHSLIIPQFKKPPKTDIFKLIVKIIEENKELPILAFGSSAILLMSILNSDEELENYSLTQMKYGLRSQVYAFTSHTDPFFGDLNVKTRLQIQNKMKILSTEGSISVQKFAQKNKHQKMKILGLGRSKQQWRLLMARQNKVYYCFVNPELSAVNSEAITFYHHISNNFIEQVRKSSRMVEQKLSEIGQYKMILKDNRYVYNCDQKLPKI